MKPICIIPARGGSKGVPKKNIRKIAGKPLLGHVIEQIDKSKIFSAVIVSTEDLEIAKIARKHGADVPFMRPKNLATDTTPMDKVLLHKKSIQLLRKKKVPVVCAVYEQHLNPYFNIVETNSDGFLKLSKKLKTRPMSRQQAPKVYQLNGLYTYDARKFLKIKKTDFGKSIPLEIPLENGLMIDTEFEFKISKLLLETKSVKLK